MTAPDSQPDSNDARTSDDDGVLSGSRDLADSAISASARAWLGLATPPGGDEDGGENKSQESAESADNSDKPDTDAAEAKAAPGSDSPNFATPAKPMVDPELQIVEPDPTDAGTDTSVNRPKPREPVDLVERAREKRKTQEIGVVAGSENDRAEEGVDGEKSADSVEASADGDGDAKSEGFDEGAAVSEYRPTTEMMRRLDEAAADAGPPQPSTETNLDRDRGEADATAEGDARPVTKPPKTAREGDTSVREKEKAHKFTAKDLRRLLDSSETVEGALGQINERFAKIESHINKLVLFFNDRFRVDRTKEQAFDKLYESLKEYKDNFLHRAQRPVFMDLILLHDDIEKFEQATEDEQSKERFGMIREMVLEILYRRDIEKINKREARYDANFQKATVRVETDNPDEDMQVVEVRREGFTWEDKVIRPQEVVVKRHGIAASMSGKREPIRLDGDDADPAD